MLGRTKRQLGVYLRQSELPLVLRGLLGIYLFIYVWSVPMLMLGLVPAWGRGMGGFLLILQGTIMGLWLAGVGGRHGVAAAGIILALSYLVELVGVRTGVPFGRYAYTSTLGLQLGGAVPLAIPFAWLLVVPSSLAVAAAMTRGAAVVPLAGLLALLLDLLIEPVAARVGGYWRWIETGPYYGVPTANFIAWGCTALGLVLVLRLALRGCSLPSRVVRLPVLLFVLNAIQFTLVDAAYGFWWAAGAGVTLLTASLALIARSRQRSIGTQDR